jgi:hypothetical protein
MPCRCVVSREPEEAERSALLDRKMKMVPEQGTASYADGGNEYPPACWERSTFCICSYFAVQTATSSQPTGSGLGLGKSSECPTHSTQSRTVDQRPPRGGVKPGVGVDGLKNNRWTVLLLDRVHKAVPLSHRMWLAA